MSSSVTATRSDTTDSKTTPIAILICGRHNNASVSKGGGGSGSDGKNNPPCGFGPATTDSSKPR